MADRQDFATAVGTLVKSARWTRGVIQSGTDLNTLTTPGVYRIASSVVAASVTPALPAAARNSGVLEVLEASGVLYVIQRWSNAVGSVKSTWQRELSNTTWTAWRQTDVSAVAPRFLPQSANIDTYVRSGGAYDGDWVVDASVLASVTGLPESRAGLLTVDAGIGSQTYQAYAGGLWWRTLAVLNPLTWKPWVRLDDPDANVSAKEPVHAAERHGIRVEQLRKTKGGRIGTGGVAAVALRFDDWHAEFETLVAPILKKYNLPCFKAVTPGMHEDSGVTWETAKTAAHDHAFEVTCHSWDHTNATGLDGTYKAIVESADYLESKVDLPIRLWTFPGISGHADTAFDGVGIGKTPDLFWSTRSGRMLMARYPVVHGGTPGHHASLNGWPTTGQSNYTYEAFTLPQFEAAIADAQEHRAGVTLMAHPWRIGTTGYMSVADFDAAMGHVAAERDAGRLLVLTGTGLAVADASTDYRMDLLDNGDFSQGMTGWAGYTWAVTDGIATTSGAYMLSQSINFGQWTGMEWAHGETVEIVARVKVTGGATINLDATANGLTAASTTYVLPASADWVTIRKCFTIPRAFQNVRIAFHPTAVGGPVQVDSIHVQPI